MKTLREKMAEYRQKTGYDKMTAQERKASAEKFLVDMQSIRTYDPALLEKGYLRVRKAAV